MKKTQTLLLMIACAACFVTAAPASAQGETANPAEFTLTDFSDAALGLSFKRPTTWTQDPNFNGGIRFAGGDEWLSLQIISSNQTPVQYTANLAVMTGETKIGVKPFKQGKFFASVYSSSAIGKSGVTGKPTDLLIDRWVFSPRVGKLVVLTVGGPKKVFDWEGNRDIALSVRLK